MAQKPRKHLTIEEYQEEWLESHAPDSFNLSGFLRDQLDEVIPEEEIPSEQTPDDKSGSGLQPIK